MLVLSRKTDQKIQIGRNITITILRVKKNSVKIGVEAPDDLPIARGELLDTESLLDLLEAGHLWAAALDTVDGEYEPAFSSHFAESRLACYARAHDNLILTPHIGGSTVDAWTETEKCVIDEVAGYLGLHEGR